MGYFNRLIGNDETKTRLANAITSDSLAHAFLISGPSGSGKSTLALELSAALNCEKANGSPHTPCGVCNNCRRIYEGNFPDLKFLEKPKDKATIGVEAVKDFREDMFLSSTEAERKIYVIDNADCMTVEAQNALLKILEEPPRYTAFILTADNSNAVIGTVLSRVVRLRMGKTAVTQYSEKAVAVTGKFIEAVLSPYEYNRIEATAPLDGNKTLTAEVLGALVAVLRDAIALKSGGKTILEDFTAESKKLSDNMNLEKLLKMYDTVAGLLRSLENNPNYNLLSTVLCAKI